MLKEQKNKYYTRTCKKQQKTHRKEYPLQHLAILIRILLRIPTKLILCVVMLLEVDQDSRSLKDDEIVPAVVYNGGNATVWVDRDEPGVLYSF